MAERRTAARDGRCKGAWKSAKQEAIRATRPWAGSFELADRSLKEYPYGLARIEFLGERTKGRVVFGPAGCEPLSGITSLESVGRILDGMGY